MGCSLLSAPVAVDHDLMRSVAPFETARPEVFVRKGIDGLRLYQCAVGGADAGKKHRDALEDCHGTPSFWLLQSYKFFAPFDQVAGCIAVICSVHNAPPNPPRSFRNQAGPVAT